MDDVDTGLLKEEREYALQFGHSVAAVDDTGGTYAPRPRRTRFNSATASPPWMTSRFFGTSG